MNALFGFGGFKMSCGSEEAYFSGNTGKLRFRKLAHKWVSRDNVPRQNIIGWLPEISVTLHNLKTEHSLEYANLVSVVNEHTATGTPITITPRYDETDDYGLAYDCVIDSDFDPQDIANCNAGQTIDLVFYGTETYMSIPNVFSGLELYDVVDYNGDSVVDGSGNEIIMIQ